MAEASDNRQPLSKNQLGIAVVVLVVIVAVALGLYFLLKSSPKKHAVTGKYKPIVAAFLSTARMKTETLIAGEGFYWAGPIKGLKNEFRRDTNGNVYVRYMPPGTHPGQRKGNFLVIATYPGYNVLSLKQEAKKKHATIRKGPGGSSIYVDPKRPRDVYMAFKDVNAEIEIFAPTPTAAIQIARSGKIRIPH